MSLERFNKAVTEMRTKQAAARDHRSYGLRHLELIESYSTLDGN